MLPQKLFPSVGRRCMNKLLAKEVQEFINANLKTDLHSLLLKKSPFPEISMQEIVQQIKGRKVAQKKFPFLDREGMLFPPQLNLEQASSEETASFKSRFFRGKRFADLTCGFGIDAYFLSEHFEDITLVEQNTELLHAVCHNWQRLGRKAITVNRKLEDYLKQTAEKFDLIYLDPARRDERQRKVFLLEGLSPNLLEIQDRLTEISEEVLIKLSPLIDLEHLISTLQGVAKIWIIAVKNEVKEVLVLLKKVALKTEISCVNLQSLEPEFNFIWNEVNGCKPNYSSPKKYLYLPNGSVLKAGAFDGVAEKFGLDKLHPNTHLYTSEARVEHFPGRTFEVEETEAKGIAKNSQYNLIAKNYPLKPEEIKKRYKTKDGGEDYLIFTQSVAGKHILKAKLL